MDLFEKLKLNKAIPPFLAKKGHFVVEESIGAALLIATAYKENPRNYLLVTSNLFKAQQLYNLLTYFVDKDNVMLFPADELIRAESISQSKEFISQRLFVLNQLKDAKKKIVVAPIASACRYLPKPELFHESVFHFEVGKSYNLSEIRTLLAKAGYLNVNKVDSSLQFAVRGDILDIFSVNLDNPVRIEFFGDEIEDIRFFDIATQTSISKVDSVSILPASDMLLSPEEVEYGIKRININFERNIQVLPQNKLDLLRINLDEIIDKIQSGDLDQQVYKYYSFITKEHYSLFDYCEGFTRVFIGKNQILNSNHMLIEESWHYLNDLYEANKVIQGLDVYQDLNKLVNLNASHTIVTEELCETGYEEVFNVKNVPFQASKTNDIPSIIRTYLNDEYKIIISLSNKDQMYLTQEILESENLTYQSVKNLDIPTKCKIGLSLFTIPRGFVLSDEKVVVLTSLELFNTKIKSSRYDNKFKEATILKSYEELEPGDYVVHEYQGIGQFIGLDMIETDGKPMDYLKIAYSGDTFLYVPLNQFQLVRKYIGKEGYKPRLSRLGTKDWEKTKKRIKERINDLANRLMHLYIERSKVKGFAFQEDDEFQKAFESAFPYDLTPDQDRAMREIKEDMQSEHPMDRLLCGDVGFGKTELAFRAAFKAISSGKQVAILCPTTLLARQHYELAVERFAPFDIKIGLLSRLVKENKQKEYIEGVNRGEIHLLIGTHRVLSKDVSFNDLGLLIIDEEQRFGVEQKEKIKEIKSNIDVLTLSATPIPRTLQISLLGVRSLSQISTAPKNRMPIQTYVTPFKFEVVKELIEREFGRNGQVFFMHNQVETIYAVAAKLQKLVPSAVIGVAHGQMSKNEIEDVMDRFYNNEVNLLVCTSIVENGIDVPNANMIIVQDADRYGLSQLYQIKGRVGRSDRIAYAYLMYPENKILKEPAKKRLKALQDFTELGSGYKIAQRDLMIRGAGDVLGPEQAGFIDNIGLDMYLKLLNEAVRDKLEGSETEEEKVKLNLTLSLNAYIPDSYAKDGDKIALYQEIISAVSVEQLNITRQKIIDIYGKMPESVELLIEKRRIDIASTEACVKTLSERPNSIEIVLSDEYTKIRGIGNILFECLIPYIRFTKVLYKNHEFYITMQKDKKWLQNLRNILIGLANILKTNKVIGDKREAHK